MMEKLISIVIPIYNTEIYLEKCLLSVINQTYKNLEIILINDGSMDNSILICRKYLKQDNRIKIIDKENAGVSAARNDGIKISKGEYILFVDSDDWIELNMVEILYENSINKKIDLYICGFYTDFLNKKTYKKQNFFSGALSQKEALRYIHKENSFGGFICNKLFNKRIIFENDLLFDININMCEDLLFSCQYISKIKSIYYENIPLYHYIQRNDSACYEKINKKKLTILSSYEKIFDLYKKLKINSIELKTMYLILNLNIKFNIKINNKQKEYFESFQKCQNNINKYIKEVLNNKNVNITIKVKIIIYYILPNTRCLFYKIFKNSK